MNEQLEKLQAAVQDLEQAIGDVDTLDPQARQALEQAARDIQQALAGSSEPAVTALSVTAPSVTERLQEAARQFETSHPTLAGVLERIVDALGQLGI